MHCSVVIMASCCLPCLWMPIITSNLSPVTSVVRKPEWITYFTSSHCSDGGRIGRTSIPCIQQWWKCSYQHGHPICHERIQHHQLQTRDMLSTYSPTYYCKVGQGWEGEFGERKTDEGKKIYKELKKNDWHARHAGTKEVCTKYMNMIKENHPSIHEYLKDWGNSQFFYTHDQPHFGQDTNNPCKWESEWSNAIEDWSWWSYTWFQLLQHHLSLYHSRSYTFNWPDDWNALICDLIPNLNQAKFHHPTLLGVNISAKPFLE